MGRMKLHPNVRDRIRNKARRLARRHKRARRQGTSHEDHRVERTGRRNSPEESSAGDRPTVKPKGLSKGMNAKDCPEGRVVEGHE